MANGVPGFRPKRRAPSFSSGYATNRGSEGRDYWRDLTVAFAPFLGPTTDPTKLLFGPAVKSGTPAFVGGRSTPSGALGWGWEFTATTDSLTLATMAAAFPNGGATIKHMTVLVGFRQVDGVGRNAMVWGSSSGGGSIFAGTGLFYSDSGGGGATRYWLKYEGITGNPYVLGANYSRQNHHVLAVRGRPKTTSDTVIWVDGEPRTSGSSVPTGSFTGNLMMGDGANGLSGDKMIIDFIYVWSTYLPDKAIAEITADPGMMFRPAEFTQAPSFISAHLSSTGAITASLIATGNMAATLSSSGGIAANPGAMGHVQATLTSTGSIAAVKSGFAGVVSTLSSVGGLSASAELSRDFVASMTSTGSITATLQSSSSINHSLLLNYPFPPQLVTPAGTLVINGDRPLHDFTLYPGNLMRARVFGRVSSESPGGAVAVVNFVLQDFTGGSDLYTESLRLEPGVDSVVGDTIIKPTGFRRVTVTTQMLSGAATGRVDDLTLALEFFNTSAQKAWHFHRPLAAQWHFGASSVGVDQLPTEGGVPGHSFNAGAIAFFDFSLIPPNQPITVTFAGLFRDAFTVLNFRVSDFADAANTTGDLLFTVESDGQGGAGIPASGGATFLNPYTGMKVIKVTGWKDAGGSGQSTILSSSFTMRY